MNPYSYPSVKPNFSLRLKQTNPKWFRYGIDFPTACPTQWEEANTVRGEYFRPQDRDRFPLVILLPGIGDIGVLPCRLLGRHLAKRGIATVVLYLVFHSSRMPEVMKARFPALTSEEWFEVYRISVIDVRQMVDWAKSMAEIDDNQIAVIGMSLGGMLSAIAMGIDKRISAGVFLIAGGNWQEITWKSKSKFTRRKEHSCTEAECHHIYSHHPQYLADIAEKGLDKVTPVKECFLTDPLTYASFLRGRPVMMVNALWDRIIPKRSVLDFWEACGKPRITWLPATHVTIFLWYPLISRKITGFLKSAFRM